MKTYEAVKLYNAICTEIKSTDLIDEKNLSLDVAELDAKNSFLYETVKNDVYIMSIDTIDHIMFKDTMIACRSETEIQDGDDGPFEYIKDGLFIYFPRVFVKIVKLVTILGLDEEFDVLMDSVLKYQKNSSHVRREKKFKGA